MTVKKDTNTPEKRKRGRQAVGDRNLTASEIAMQYQKRLREERGAKRIWIYKDDALAINDAAERLDSEQLRALAKRIGTTKRVIKSDENATPSLILAIDAS